jgi:hypothetical protein
VTFKYVIAGNGCKAIAVHSGLNLPDMQDYIREKSKKFHEDGDDRVFRMGAIELVNPIVYCANDFADRLPYLIEME